MRGDHVVLIAPRPTASAGAPAPAAVRFLALLPEDWHYEPDLGDDHFTVRLAPPAGTTPAPDLTHTLDHIFRDPSLRSWHWTDITHHD
ncbi:hypothetical protein [Streptomyces scabiei]|uniref:hypothetical protein n=4 Tax=Streptomyces TaxID=1883 RepID=UPI0005A25741|nr:hypothetical protein [Streptomyces scabiei]MDX2650736.1 hypothetical protein [Streptomyces scabiei]MDX2719922.1 hypothetical protein [Streptomyces scabiei]MDX2871165.1 hypothetical protein [Streptomyces scabiei]MDX2885944.1 hypothetical protein [Streptomyces scabiei]MDX2904426.1 hypothetical protein [Streptomyces scabiei]